MHCRSSSPAETGHGDPTTSLTYCRYNENFPLYVLIRTGNSRYALQEMSRIMLPVFCSAGVPVTEPRLIRKYANRRLYDSTDSRHVTLDDIRKLVASGINVKVIDDKSSADLTRAVLLQIIAEQEQFGQPVLSTQLLEGIIRFYGNPVQEMLSRYLEQSLGNVLRQQQTLQAEIARTMGTPLTPLTELTRQNMEMWARMQASMLSAMTPPTPPASTPSPDAPGQPAKEEDSGKP